jgi:hypothetical protein
VANPHWESSEASPIKRAETLACWSQVEVDLPLLAGISAALKIKRSCVGRFIVTAGYLVSADQIQIKDGPGLRNPRRSAARQQVNGYPGALAARYSVPASV